MGLEETAGGDDIFGGAAPGNLQVDGLHVCLLACLLAINVLSVPGPMCQRRVVAINSQRNGVQPSKIGTRRKKEIKN